MGKRAWQRVPSCPAHGTSEGLRGQFSLIVALDRDLLTDRVGKLARAKLELILTGIDVILGR
jgi:hypothetical protein